VPQKVILDVDPGIDDALAIIAALNSRLIDVIGITVATGNVNSEVGASNALRLLNAVDRLDIPIFQGALRPLQKNPVYAEDIHGKGGLGEIDLETLLPQAPSRPDHMPILKGDISNFVDSLLKSYNKDEVSIISTAPLTNIAQIILDSSIIPSRINQIYIMGGAFGVDGNITKYAEFNFYCDPEAAKIVLSSEAMTRIVGLNVTHTPGCAIHKEFLGRLSRKSKKSALVSSMLAYPLSVHGIFHLHDLFAIAMFECPSLFELKRGNVSITLSGTMRGHSEFRQNDAGTNFIATKVNENGFNNYIFDKFGDL
jgi:inosine-uridine nucleoside N-ribohydrolase